METQEQTLGLGIYFEALKRRTNFIALFVACAFALSVAACFALPEKFEARASVMPPRQPDMGGLATAVSAGLGDLAGGLLGMQSTADVWVGVLKSNMVADAMIERFGLKESYGAATIERARKKLRKSVVIEISREDIVSVTVEDKDPQKAADMANAFIEELDKVNKSVSMTSGSRAKAFLEARLDDASRSLEAAELAHRDFQAENRALKLDEQSKALIESYGGLKGALMAKEVELRTFLSFATAENPRTQMLSAEIGELRSQLSEMYEGGEGDALSIPASRYPDLAVKYARVLRELKVQQTLFELLTQQFELSRIQEAKDTPTVQFLDIAKRPEQPSKPRKAVLIALFTTASIFIAVFLSLLLEFRGHLARRLL